MAPTPVLLPGKSHGWTHCRQILYPLSHQGSPGSLDTLVLRPPHLLPSLPALTISSPDQSCCREPLPSLPWEHLPPTKKAHQAEMCSDWEPELSCLFLAAVPTSITGDHQATPGIHLCGSSVGWTAPGASPQIQNSRTQI